MEKMGMKCDWSAADILRGRLGRMWVLELSHGKTLRKRKMDSKVEREAWDKCGMLWFAMGWLWDSSQTAP